MPTFTILPHAWAKDLCRIKPVLRSFALGLALLFGVASQALAAIINVPADYATISAAVTAAAAGDVIIVGPGTYNENVIVNKSLIIRSSGGKGSTFINGSTGTLGTFLIQANDVTIGGFGQGFTIKGYDNANPAVEYAAVYIQGVRSNITIRDNEIIADGEAGLLTDFGQAVTNLVINGNVFSGKTFVGAQPAECGFGTQFTVHNVPRQLAAIATGSNITFTSNSITGISGGTSSASGCELTGQGNTMVTIDASNVTIRGNTFAGTTTRFGSSLRCRGTNVSIYCNTFDNTGLGPICKHIVFNAGLTALTGGASPSTIAGVASSNTYLNEGAYFTGAIDIWRDAAQVTAIPQSPIACNNIVQANVTNTNTGEKFCSIQSAISDANTVDGHTISVAAGTYNEDVIVNKDLTIQGAGMNVCTVSGPIGGGGATFQVSASGVTIDGFTITRDGNNLTDWNNANLNIPGIAIQGQTVNAEIKNCKIIGNRTGIDINNSNGNNIHNNIITFNRTGMIFRNQTDNTLLNENDITDNWTLGVLFLDASSGTNIPVQSALNSSFNNNNISGNWYGQIQDRQSGGSLPTPGTTNMKNFDCNWYGTTSPVVTVVNSSEPGYAAQIPVAYGGTAVPPGGQPDVLGTASANLDYLLFLVSGTDNNLSTNGFQPMPLSCTGGCPGGGVVINENSGGIFCSIQAAIAAATTNDRLKVKTGTYTENVDAASVGKNIKFAPGNSPGCVTINGDYTLNAGDVLEMEIEGTTACTGYDQFLVNGVVTLGGATLTVIPSMFLAVDGDVITLIDNDGADPIVGKFAQGNFVTDGQNTYYIDYEGGTGNDVVLTKCCGALVDLGVFTSIVAPVDNPPMQQDVLAGHKLVIKARPTKDMVNAIYTQGTFTLRTLTNVALVNFAGDNVHSSFGYAQIGAKQTVGGYDYFVFSFENGSPAPINWLKNVEYDLLTLTYTCAAGAQSFELVTNPTDPNAPVSGKFYQEINGETSPGAQGVFYQPSATGPAVLAITATSNSPVCETMNIDLNSTTTGGSAMFGYAWTGPNTYTNTVADPAAFAAVLASAGIYQVSVTDGNGCTATATTSVVVPGTGACVQNETNMPNQYYPTIKQAIDAVLTIPGDVLNVPAGTWPENVNVTKAVTLNGVYENVPCDDVTRTGAESIITGGAGIAVNISSNGVTINGFQLEGSIGVSSTGFNKATIKNNKVNAREIGIGSTLLVASATDPYSINDNCIDFPVQAFDQQAFFTNPTLSATQAPGVWYTDRYAPAGFVSTGASTFRLQHTISAADCEGCRPGGFNTAFYNTQGRKYDIAGTTAMSIQLYIPTGWDITNKRMAGFWGTALNAGNSISFYPIIEFTSDGGNPRFRAYNSAGLGSWVDMGLPAGFAYDQWYTLNIAIDGANIRYNVGNLSVTLPGLGSVSIANVILQGHNAPTPGVTYDILWDNLNTHGSDDIQTAATVGIALAAASGTDDVTLQDNNVSDAFYGYVLSGVTAASADRTTVKGGTYSNLLQGVAVVNTLDGVNFAPSSIGVENANFESFGGNYPNIPAANFHAGIYAFTGGSNAAHNVDILVKNVTLKNTGKTAPNSAGLYLADFSTGAGNRLNATVSLSTIQDNKNRGVEVRGANATATVTTSHILGNGADPFGAGGNHGFGVYAGVGSLVTLNNNFIANPGTQISDNVTALFEGVAPASTIIAGSNSIVRNGNGLLANTTTGTINGSTNCNWWGDANPNVFDAFISGAVTYDPYLNSGADAGGDPTNGFQPAGTCTALSNFYVNDDVYLMGTDLITYAVGLDGPATRGTAHRPYRHINAAIGAATSGVGHTVRVDIGNYNDEQVLVNKTLTILGTDGLSVAKPIINFTGTPGADLTLFHVTSPGVTIEHFTMDVDLSKLHSAIVAKGTNGTGLTVKNNMINPYRSLASIASTYGNRNAITINHANYYTGSTNPTGILIQGNMVTYSSSGNPLLSGSDDAGFRSGAATDEGVGTFTGNTFQTINHDIIARWSGPGAITVSNNTFNGGGVELTEFNSGTGALSVTNNNFNGAFAAVAVTPKTAVLRLKNNQQNKVTTVSGNTFADANWAFSLENYKNVTVDDNVFTPLAGSTDYLHVGVNTKLINSSSNTVVQTMIGGTFTNNLFNGSGTLGGLGMGFFNHDSDNDMIGTFTVGTNGNENEFASTIATFARLDDQLGSTDPATFPTNYPDGGGWLTTMACWDVDVDLTHNKFDVGSGLQKPLAMNNAQRVLLEGKLYHKPDNACLGKFFQTVEVMAKVFLQGPYDPADGPNGRMVDALRTITTGMSPFPLAQPHGAINTAFPGSFVEMGNAGLESITTTVRDFVDPNNSIVDWIWLELRDKNNPNTKLFTRSALVQRDGDIVDLDGTSEVAFPNAYQDQYYLMVRHRNHLACMTAAPIDFSVSPLVDFTTAAQPTFGATSTSARRLIKTGIYGLWAGNTFPKDEAMNGGAFRLLYNGSNNDRAPILTRVGFSTPLNVVTGYYIEDVNLNGEVKYSGSGNDRVIILNNVGASTPLNFITQEPNN